MRSNWPGDAYIFLQYRSFIHEHIGPAGREALIGIHIFLWHFVCKITHKGYRLCRIADIFVVARRASSAARRVERKSASRTEIERLRHSLFRRPCGIPPPHVRSGLENKSFGKLRIAIAL